MNLDGNLYGFLLFFCRVLRPPGGMSSNIFSDSDSASVTSSNESRASSTSPKTPQKQYKMASNFELGDEQPENPSPRRKPFKPSGNSCFDHRWRFKVLPPITITNCSESFDWRIGRLSWSDYSGRKTCTIHH